MDKNINTKKISKNNLIKLIAKRSEVSMSMVKIVLESLEDTVFETMKNTANDNNISIRLFDGLFIDSTYIDSKNVRSNLTGEIINVRDKIKVKPRVTKGYIEKLNK